MQLTLGFPSGDLSSPEYAKEMYNKTDFSESTRDYLVLFSLQITHSKIFI